MASSDRLASLAPIAWAALSVGLASAQSGPNPDFQEKVVIPYFQEENPKMVNFQTFFKQPIDDQHTLLVVRGGAPDSFAPVASDFFWWDPGTLVGIFVVETATVENVWKVALLPDQGCDCTVKVGRVDRESIALSRFEVDYGWRLPSLKVFFDLESKRGLKTTPFSPLGISDMEPKGDHLQLTVGAESTERITLRDDPLGIRLARGSDAKKFPYELANWKPLPYEASVQTPYAIDPEARYSLIPSEGHPASALGVAEKTLDGAKPYALPQSSWEDYRRLRPEAVGRCSKRYELVEGIGPYQVVGKEFWFGKVFYDGEGLSGIGGIGYFDMELNKYVLHIPEPIVNFSTSALLVDGRTAWAGLAVFPEGETYGFGLLRFELETAQAELFEVHEVILTIVRWGDRIVAGTSESLLVVRDGAVTRYSFEPDLEGRLQLYSQALAR